MARARNIKPDFFTDETVMQLSAHARLMFIGLWTLADCEGRLEDKPLQIKVRILPMDEVNGDILLNEIQSAGLISRYVVKDKGFIQVGNFLKHQNPHPNEKKKGSRYPEESRLIATNHDKSRAIVPDPSSLDPDSPIPDHDSTGKPEKVKKKRAKKKKEDSIDGLSKDQSTQCQFFIDNYPGPRPNPGRVKTWWRKHKPDSQTCGVIIAGVEAHKNHSKQWISSGGEFIPGGEVFLNGEMWLNVPDAALPRPKSQHQLDIECSNRKNEALSKVARFQELTLEEFILAGYEESQFEEYNAQRLDPSKRISAADIVLGVAAEKGLK